MKIEENKPSIWRFEKKLLAIKFVYFLTYSGVAAMLPFFVTYYYDIGLTATELSIIQAAVTFSAFVIRPLVSKIADATKYYRACLVICLLWCAVLHLPHMAIPKVPTNLAVFNDTPTLGQPVVEALVGDGPNFDKHSAKLSDANNSVISSSSPVDESDLVSFMNWMSQSRTNIFVVLLVLRLIASIGSPPALSLIDTFTHALSRGDQKEWGRQRCYSTFGWAFATLLIGYIIHVTGSYNYLFTISIHHVFAVIAVVFLKPLRHHSEHGSKDRKEEGPTTKRQNASLMTVLCQPHVVVYLLFTIINGILLAAEYHFLFLFLKDGGADELLIGLHQAVDCVSELPMFFFSGYVTKSLGYVPCFCLSFVAYIIRLTSYSFLDDPLYLVLLVELTHGFSYTLFLSAGSGYADVLTPPNCPATLQGIFHSFYFSLGIGFGDLIGGYLYPYLGARWFFRCMAIVSVICTAIYTTLWFTWLRKLERQQQNKQPDSGGAAFDANDIDLAYIEESLPDAAEVKLFPADIKNKNKKPGIRGHVVPK